MSKDEAAPAPPEAQTPITRRFVGKDHKKRDAAVPGVACRDYTEEEWGALGIPDGSPAAALWEKVNDPVAADPPDAPPDAPPGKESGKSDRKVGEE